MQCFIHTIHQNFSAEYALLWLLSATVVLLLSQWQFCWWFDPRPNGGFRTARRGLLKKIQAHRSAFFMAQNFIRYNKNWQGSKTTYLIFWENLLKSEIKDNFWGFTKPRGGVDYPPITSLIFISIRELYYNYLICFYYNHPAFSFSLVVIYFTICFFSIFRFIPAYIFQNLSFLYALL